MTSVCVANGFVWSSGLCAYKSELFWIGLGLGLGLGLAVQTLNGFE